jgi:gliding motility-associated-like protein
MKKNSWFILLLILISIGSYAQIPNRGCGTQAPTIQYDSLFQQKIVDYLNTTTAASRVQSTFQIPVIFHVIHGGQTIGTFPNIAQAQLNSQVQVLNDDYSGIGFNIGTYPATAFQAYATNTLVAAASKDGLGRIGISNTGISFCLALKDSLGNVLTEPGIERINWNSIVGASNPALITTAANLMTLMDNTIKPSTIWSPNKYLNIWITDVNPSVGLLGYATFPPLSGLTGISAAGTATTDGLWCWAKTCGSQNIFAAGVYSAPYNYGRTLTHEISHYLGIRHTWGDISCGNDFCNDTPPEQSGTTGSPTYPYLPNACPSYTPPTGPEGVMFMNFADYTADAAMYMFTEDQKIRMQTAMTNSPYRNQLGTHGFCSPTATVQASFSLSSTVINQGQSVNITDLSTASAAITSWNYSCLASTPSTSSMQNPTLTFNTAGTHTISLTVTAAGINSTATKTIQVNACPIPTVNVNSINPTCAGACNGSATLVSVAGSGAPYTYSWTPAVSSSSVVSGLCAGVYTCVVTNSCGVSVTKPITVIQPSSMTVTILPSSTVVCVGDGVDLTVSVAGGTGTTYSYNWSNGASVSSTSVIPIITPSVNYTVNVQDLNGCIKTSAITISVNPIPSITVTPNNPTICAGKTTTVNLSGALNFTTNPGNITASTFTLSPTVTTVYSITGASPFGCIASRIDSIKVVNTPTISSSVNSNTVCFGSSITFSNSGGASYTLSPSAIAGNTINITPTVLGTTVFTVTGAGPFGCINTKTISVTTFSLPLVSITPSNTTICAGQPVVLNVSGANTYTWTTGSSLNVISVTPTAPTSYSVIGANSFGCQNSASTTINVLNTPVVTINTPSTSVCFGYTMTVAANGASNYNWSTGATTNTTIIQPFSNTTFSVVGTNGGSCSDTAFLSLSVMPLPSVSASVSHTMACVGQNITLNASGDATQYVWNPGLIFGTNPVVQIFTPTTFTVLGTGSNGCVFFSTAFVDVQNGNAVIPVVTPSAVCIGDTAVLSIIGGTIPSWSTNVIPNTSFVTPVTPTNYTFSASDLNGCVSDIVFTVEINTNCDVIIYNGFTPNGDGVNDFFVIENIDKYPNNNVHIFNRWGDKVFTTSGYDNTTNNWDGKLNGKPVTSGTYFYLITNNNGNVVKKGWLEITN